MPREDDPALARSDARRQGRALALVALVHGLLYVVLLAPWMGEDEPFHLENAALVARGHLVGQGPEFSIRDVREAPVSHLQQRRAGFGDDLAEIAEVEDGILASMREARFWERVDWAPRDAHPWSFDALLVASGAAHQPRLYYAVVAPFLLLAPGASPLVQLYIARTVSLVLFVGTVLLAFGAARRAFPRGPGAMLVGLGIALWPMSARMAAVVNNDVLARFLVALTVYAAARWLEGAERARAAGVPAAPGGRDATARWRAPAALIAVTALAVATKPTAASAVVVAALAVLLHPASSRRVVRTVALLGGLGVVFGAGAMSYIARHNPSIRPYWQANWQQFLEGLTPRRLTELSSTLVGRYNWESRGPRPDLSEPIGFALLGLVALGVLALVRRVAWTSRRILGLALGASAAQLLLVVARGVGKGRYLMPAAPALAILVVAGLLLLVPARHHRRVAAIAVSGLVLFSGFFALTGLVHENWIAWGS